MWKRLYIYILPQNFVFEEASIPANLGLEYIVTDLRRSYSESASYLIGFPEEETSEMIRITKTDNIVFESTTEFDPSYYLRVDDITEKITEIQSASVKAKTDKILVELYDINMLDKDNKVVDTGNGTYTIKVALSDLLKKYNEYQVVYINDSGVD